MSVEIDNVLKFAELNKAKPHWRLYAGHDVTKQSNLVGSTESFISENGVLTPQRSQEALKATLELLPPGDYKLGLKTQDKDNSNIVYHTFRIPGTTPGIASPVMQPQQQHIFPKDVVTVDTMQTLIDAAIGKANADSEKRFLQYQLDQMKKELDQVKREKKPDTNWLVEVGKQIVPLIAARIAPPAIQGPQIAISGHNSTNVEPVEPTDQGATENGQTSPNEPEISPAEQKALLQCLEQSLREIYRLAGGSKQGIILLYQLSRYMDENPDVFKSIVLQQIEKYKSELAEHGITTDTQ
jgi:hypothetical protein